jgi:hypothetical protein
MRVLLTFVVLIVIVASSLVGQTRRDVRAAEPQNMRQLCQVLEGDILSNRAQAKELTTNPPEGQSPDQVNASLTSRRAAIEADELSWSRLGCVQILYPPGSGSSGSNRN